MEYLLFGEEELKVVNLLSKVRNLVHVSVEASALLQFGAHLVVGQVSVSALSDVDLVRDSLVVAVLALQIVELLSELGDECVLLGALYSDGFVS